LRGTNSQNFASTDHIVSPF